jgi:hypothetical protein
LGSGPTQGLGWCCRRRGWWEFLGSGPTKGLGRLRRCRASLWTAACAEQALHLLCDSFLAWRAEHASGVDAVLLGKLAGVCVDSSLVEDGLHCLKYVLSMWCRCGICVLLATHHHLYNFADLNRR